MLPRYLLILAGICALILIGVPVDELAAQDDGTGRPPIDLTPPTLGDFDPESVEDIDPEEYPILPTLTDHARYIYEQGQAAGNRADVFSKVGDCMTASPLFMTPFGAEDYDLGDEYADLQAAIDYWGASPLHGEDSELNSFATISVASTSGFNTASIQDPLWADPAVCEANESPLACEYRLANPSLAIIMVGTNDVFYFEAESFDYYLRLIVLETINRNIVPVLNTFPARPEFPEKSLLFNQVIIKVAQDYDLPLINLWLAIQTLPNHGVDEVETIHLTAPEDQRTGDFTETNLEAGYTYRNLVTLQALDILRIEFEALGETEAG